MIDWSHYRTPRAMHQTKWGAYSKFESRKKESAWWYVAACAVMIVMVFIACYRG